MPSYQCKVGTTDGRIVDKIYDSTTREQLKENLEEQGFHVFQMRRQSLSFFQGGLRQSAQMTGRRFLSFNQELLVLLRSGLP
ncbi:MAG: type II secretion system F family protein, partial [Desulfuromusa sp.]|nr:type II secretion system F family protein [Desulfuromusa sp.]